MPRKKEDCGCGRGKARCISKDSVVSLPKPAYVKEHKVLLETLKHPTKKKLAKEIQEQSADLAKVGGMDNNLEENLLGDGPREVDLVPFVKPKVLEEFIVQWSNSSLPDTMTPDTFDKFEAYWEKKVQNAKDLDRTKMFQETTGTGPIIITDPAEQNKLYKRNLARVTSESNALRAHFKGILESRRNVKLIQSYFGPPRIEKVDRVRGGAELEGGSPLGELVVRKNMLIKKYDSIVNQITHLEYEIDFTAGWDERAVLLDRRDELEYELVAVQKQIKKIDSKLKNKHDIGKGSGAPADRVKELLDEFMRTHKGKTSVTAMKKWVAKKMKEEDCGCGCKGKKSLTGGKLNDCPAGYRNDGLTCVENCKEGETDDGLFCRSKGCPAGLRDDGALLCWKDAKMECSGDWRKPVWEQGHQKCNIDHAYAVSKSRPKNVTSRVDWKGTEADIKKGFEQVFGNDGDLARLFDPNKNGVADAFNKFGKDTKEAFEEIGRRLEKAFDPKKNGVADALNKLGKDIDNAFKPMVDWFKDPKNAKDFVTYLSLVVSILTAIATTVVTFGAAGPLSAGMVTAAVSALGPVTSMIGRAAIGEPLDAMDVAGLMLAFVPLGTGISAVKEGAKAGVNASFKTASAAARAGQVANITSKSVSTGSKIARAATVVANNVPKLMGSALVGGLTTVQKMSSAQKAFLVGETVVQGYKTAHRMGLVDNPCVVNCPPPPPAENEQAVNLEQASEYTEAGIAHDTDYSEYSKETPDFQKQRIREHLNDLLDQLNMPNSELIAQMTKYANEQDIQVLKSEQRRLENLAYDTEPGKVIVERKRVENLLIFLNHIQEENAELGGNKFDGMYKNPRDYSVGQVQELIRFAQAEQETLLDGIPNQQRDALLEQVVDEWESMSLALGQNPTGVSEQAKIYKSSKNPTYTIRLLQEALQELYERNAEDEGFQKKRTDYSKKQLVKEVHKFATEYKRLSNREYEYKGKKYPLATGANLSAYNIISVEDLNDLLNKLEEQVNQLYERSELNEQTKDDPVRKAFRRVYPLITIATGDTGGEKIAPDVSSVTPENIKKFGNYDPFMDVTIADQNTTINSSVDRLLRRSKNPEFTWKVLQTIYCELASARGMPSIDVRETSVDNTQEAKKLIFELITKSSGAGKRNRRKN
jgi:hypothetical protein